MAELKNKVKFALDEARILVLGSQILLGFQFRSFFEPRFDDLPPAIQQLKFASLGVMLVVMLLLILPAAYHRIVEQGEATVDQHRFTTAVMDLTLLPFAVAIACDIYLAVTVVAGKTAGMVSAIVAASFTFMAWYGLAWVVRRKYGGGHGMTENEHSGRTPLNDKIQHVLTECRVVLPGVQTLLGFQFATILAQGFETIPPSSKHVHLASLGLVAISMVLLMMPAAFHRIVEDGEETERFHRFASRVLLIALVPLALGLSGDLFVVTRKLTRSVPMACAASICCAALFLALWFGLTIYLRAARHARMLREASHAI